MKKEELLHLKSELMSESDLDISPEEIIEQLKIFEDGIPFIKLVKACKINDGIKLIPDDKQKQLMDLFQTALNDYRVMKFVPASGAATRMFKKLQAVLLEMQNVTIGELKNRKADENAASTIEFLNNIDRFAFYKDLNECLNKEGKNIISLIESGNVTDILIFVLETKGLNYANLPKGCIKFHNYTFTFYFQC